MTFRLAPWCCAQWILNQRRSTSGIQNPAYSRYRHRQLWGRGAMFQIDDASSLLRTFAAPGCEGSAAILPEIRQIATREWPVTVKGEESKDADMVSWLSAHREARPAGLEALYDTTVSRVYGLALRICRLPQMAEEVTEDVYVQVWKTASTFDPARGRPLT